MRKKIILLTCVLILSGCSIVLKTPTELIKKPMIPNEGNSAQNSIIEALPTGAKLIRPYNTNNLSSLDYFSWDDKDKDKEIYGFYKDANNASVGVIISDKIDEEWQVRAIIDETARDIVFVRFLDFDQDGTKDILLGLSMYDQTLSVLHCYQWQGDSYVKILSENYADIIVDDLSGNQKDDIILLKLDRSNYLEAKVLQYVENNLIVFDQLILAEYDTGYYNVLTAFYDKNKKGIFIDKGIGAQYATNIIFFDGEQLASYFSEHGDDSAYEKTFKILPIKSTDIHNDGIVNIASTKVPSFYQEHLERGDFAPYLSAWHKIIDDEFKIFALSYDDIQENYRIIFPDKWFKAFQDGKLSILKSRPNAKKSYVSFYYNDGNNSYRLYTIENLKLSEYQNLISDIKKWNGSYYIHGYNSERYFIGYSYPENGNLTAANKSEFKRLLLNTNEIESLVQNLE